jgi:hypothetical protein
VWKVEMKNGELKRKDEEDGRQSHSIMFIQRLVVPRKNTSANTHKITIRNSATANIYTSIKYKEQLTNVQVNSQTIKPVENNSEENSILNQFDFRTCTIIQTNINIPVQCGGTNVIVLNRQCQLKY